MTTRAAERVDEWESRPFTDGYEQLRTLADRSFSGAVTAGRATLYMVKGTAVGVLDGTIADFEDATGTIYEAPTPALPLLAVMQKRGDEVRAKYYSEETPLSEADGKLSEGGFTGYVELSENVLSGDYYVVYQAGKSMSVAFLGESERLLSGEEAFERADEEVGIYEVRPVAIDPVEIPEPEPSTDDDVAASADADSGEQPEGVGSPPDEPERESRSTADAEGEIAEANRGDDHESTTPTRTRRVDEVRDTREDEVRDTREEDRDTREDEDRDTREDEDRDTREDEDRDTREDEDRDTREEKPRDAGEPETAPTSTGARESRASERTRRDARPREQVPAQSRDSESREPTPDSASREPTPDSRSRRTASESKPRRGPGDSDSAVTEHVDDAAVRSGDASGSTTDMSLERRAIPSVDPDRTWTPDDDRAGGEPGHTQPTETLVERSSHQSASTRRRPERQGPEPEEASAEIADLERRIEELETSRSELRTEREDLQAQLQQVREERDDLQAEVQRLRETVAELEDRLEAAEEPSSAATETPPSATGRSLAPREAIAGTNLFVRYGSKSDATLSAAHDGDVDANAVNANLSLEYHTEFDDTETTVDGVPYESFLHDTIHYRFVEWLVSDLLYEIRDTGHRSALEDLYDAIPRIDRVQFDGTVTLEDGDEATPIEESFDIVVRDRMGTPLVVTNLDDSRTATTEEMMTGLVTSATRAGQAHGRLSGAFFVTSSFFEPNALETAAEATGGGILSRDKRESFVRLSRKDGFHLCLVESRDDDFHLSVPEL